MKSAVEIFFDFFAMKSAVEIFFNEISSENFFRIFFNNFSIGNFFRIFCNEISSLRNGSGRLVKALGLVGVKKQFFLFGKSQIFLGIKNWPNNNFLLFNFSRVYSILFISKCHFSSYKSNLTSEYQKYPKFSIFFQKKS